MKVKQASFYLFCIFLHAFFLTWLGVLFGIKLKTFFYLTNISFFVNFFYVTFSFFKKSGLLNIPKETRDNLFKFGVALAVPVNILFWGLIAYDKNLLLTQTIIEIPHCLNFFLHGGNLLILMIDNLYITKHYKTNGVSKTFLICCVVFYSIFLHILYSFFGIELYGLVSKLTLFNYLLLIGIGSVFFLAGIFLHSKLVLPQGRKKSKI